MDGVENPIKNTQPTTPPTIKTKQPLQREWSEIKKNGDGRKQKKVDEWEKKRMPRDGQKCCKQRGI